MDTVHPSLANILQKLDSFSIQQVLPSQSFPTLTQQTLELASEIPEGATVLLKTPNAEQFLAGFLAALGKNCQIFLGNHQWQGQEWEESLELIYPEIIIQETGLEFQRNPLPRKAKTRIMIPTGGSSGKIRFVEHHWSTLKASVRGFLDYFQHSMVNCFCVLPLYHVSGFMQFLRSFFTGGRLILQPYKTLEIAWQTQDLETLQPLKAIPTQHYFISLVPTQLQRLLNFGAGEWLSQFQAVLLGGAPAWQSLLAQARDNNIPLALTYGMTETASQVVTLKPDQFLRGNNSVGKVLPHAKITIQGERQEELPVGTVGTIAIASQSLGLGYYPHNADWNQKQFITDDLGYFDEAGYLYIVGRNSRKIISGGENIFPDEVEAAILATGFVKDVYVMGIADQEWGEVVSAIYVPQNQAIITDMIQAQLKPRLSSYKIPKQWFAVDRIPRNEQGKVNAVKVRSLIKSLV